MISHFNDKPIPPLNQIGGKAKALMETVQAGFNVPAGMVLSVDFFEPWTTQLTATTEWRDLITNITLETCTAIQNLAKTLTFTSPQRALFQQKMNTFHTVDLFAVRSSSPEEDLGTASFAGQYTTLLGITPQKLEQSIAEAYASMFDLRVFEYKRMNQLPLDHLSIAVIVQQQINSEISGVAFSLNPHNNAFDEAVINASYGLGESIVSGQVTPDTYVVDKLSKKIIEKKINHKAISLQLNPNGGIEEISSESPKQQALPDYRILEVAELAAACEKHYGKPMDIEWAVDEDHLYLLQSRPITTYNPLFPEMITPPGAPKKIYLDLIILTQGFFESFSVLGFDIWARMFDAAKMGSMPQGTDGYLLNVNGREYSIFSNMAKGMGNQVFRLIQSYELPIREVFKTLDMEGEYRAPVKTQKMKQASRDTIRKGFILAPRIIGGILNPAKHSRIYEQCIEDTFHMYTSESQGSFYEITDRFIDQFALVCREYLRVAISGLIAMNNLKKMFANHPAASKVDLLATASPTNPTALMGQKMLELASFDEIQQTTSVDEFVANLENGHYSQAFFEAYNDYMMRHGARGIREVDIAVSRTWENPVAFFATLKSMDIEHNNIQALKERKQAAHLELREIARSMGKQKKFDHYIEGIRLLGYRETPKYLLAVLVGELRRKALALAEQFVLQKRLETVEQIFDLTIDQINAAQTDPTMKLQPMREENLAPRKTVAHVKDKDWPKIVDSRGKIFRYQRPAADGDLAGEPISSGSIQGRAKVLTTPYEKTVNKGEILVTRATEPSWTPIFINAAGVVLEIGGPLQHGAIIAREYGIPCVSGIDNATQLIKDGDLIEVDGSSGLVRFVKHS